MTRRTAPPRAHDWYEANAHRYDRLHPGVRGDAEFYASLAQGRRVLEIGAGTGRVTAALAERAEQVIALDSSAAMLARAVRRLHRISRVHLLLADAGHLPLLGCFGLVILAYRTVQYLAATERLRLWPSLAGVLAPGGLIAFDTWHGPSADAAVRGGGPHLTSVTVDELAAELRGAGLSVTWLLCGFGTEQDAQSFVRVWVVERER